MFLVDLSFRWFKKFNPCGKFRNIIGPFVIVPTINENENENSSSIQRQWNVKIIHSTGSKFESFIKNVRNKCLKMNKKKNEWKKSETFFFNFFPAWIKVSFSFYKIKLLCALEKEMFLKLLIGRYSSLSVRWPCTQNYNIMK